jgi:DNA repair exonuclease SbcCD nuclease subunit
MQNVRRFLSWLHEVILTEQPDMIVNLGDMFHTHNVVRSEVLAEVDQHLRNIANLCPYFILVGNHDMAHNKTPHIHAWLPYKQKFKTIHIVDEPALIDDMFFMPYIDDAATFNATLDNALESQLSAVFCHQTFLGANFGFIAALDGAKIPTTKTQIISGHIHKAQTMGPVWYPGTPYAQESADSNENKGIYLYSTANGAKKFIESPLPKWMTYKIAVTDLEKTVQSMNPNDRNHLVIIGEKPEIDAMVESEFFRNARKALQFSFKKDSVIATKVGTAKSVSSLEQAVVEYIDNIYKGSLDKQSLKYRCLNALQKE